MSSRRLVPRLALPSKRTRRIAVASIGTTVLLAGTVGIASARPNESEASVFTPVIPCRLLDSRSDDEPIIVARETRVVTAVGSCEVPSGATALSLNVIAVGATMPTFMTLYPAGADRPTASHLNPDPTRPVTTNSVDVKLSSDGAFAIYNEAGTTDVVIDVLGVYTLSLGGPGEPGPAGADGADGATGPMGLGGPQGPAGVDGVDGLDGATGPMGPQGPADGLDGATGPMGPQGPAGVDGFDGATGPMGPQGPAGLNGLDGATGPMGPQGPAGLDGFDGATGPMGPQGPAGLDGFDGATGPMGPQGPAGLLTSGSQFGNTPYWNGGFWVTSSNNLFNNGGSIGIGTSSPDAKLDVVGNVRIADGTQGNRKVLMSDGNGNASWNKIVTGYVLIGDVASGISTAVGGDISFADKSNSGSSSTITVNFDDQGDTNFVPMISLISLGTADDDNDVETPVVLNVTSTSIDIFLNGTSGTIQDLRINVVLTPF